MIFDAVVVSVMWWWPKKHSQSAQQFKWIVRLYLPFLMLICSENLNNFFSSLFAPAPVLCGFVTALSIAIRTSRRLRCTLFMGYRGRDMVSCLFGLKHRVRLTVTNLEGLPRIFEFGESRNLIRFVNLSRPHTCHICEYNTDVDL